MFDNLQYKKDLNLRTKSPVSKLERQKNYKIVNDKTNAFSALLSVKLTTVKSI